MLKIQFKDRRKPALWLVDSTLKLGSDPSCDIVVDDSLVDAVHAEVIVSEDDILLRNVSLQKSVFVNEVPVVGEHTLVAWDVVRLGSCELEIIDPLKERTPPPEKSPEHATILRPSVSPWMLKAVSAPLDGQYFSIANGNVIGRDKDVEIVVPLSYVSRRHAKMAVRKGKLYIEDLQSSNGTFVNGERVQSCELRNGDEIRFDQFMFKVVGPMTKVENKPRTLVRQGSKAKSDVKPPNKTQDGNKPALASQRVFFHGISPELRGKVFEITQTENHISRMLGHHLSTSEQSVSARHVYLAETELGWEIKNNGAADGLMINGKMQSRVLLQDGDEVVVGGTLLKFQSVGDKPLNYNKLSASQTKRPNNGITVLVVLVLVVAGLYFLSTL